MGYGIAHLNYNPYENVINENNAASLGALWSTQLNTTGGTPAVNNGKLFVGIYSGVAALQATTGKVMWNKVFNEAFYRL